jgi:CheY-like chemotaxis protein
MKKKQSVLIAEDDVFLAKMMFKALAPHDMKCLLAVTGKQALEKIEEEKPDLILLDLLMPETDGYEVLEHLQAQKSKTPVIVVSNLSDPKTMARCKGLGAVAYIVKSDIDEQQLWPLIEKHL